jgi:adenine-specific DNA-methyltransferase
MLARQLLTDDGAIFVAIDDHESHHLRMLMNEVFGEENFVAQIVWQKRYTRSNNTERFTSVIDHVLLYQKSEAFRPNLQPRTERDLVEFKNPDDDPRGPWKPTSFLNQVPPERRPNLTYPITNPNTGQVTENDRKAWRVNRETYERLLSEGRLWWGRDGARPIPQVKTYQSEVRQGLTPINFWSHQYAGHTDLAHAELKALFGRKVFDTPKPSLLIRRMLEHATGPEDYVLDFFAGSGSTAQAVMELNAEDGGARRYMLVQLPEPVSEGAFDTISAITRARARRVAERLASSTSDSSSHNGFRAFSLQPTQLPSWPSHDPPTDAEALLTQLHAQLEVGEQRSDGEALLFEVIPLVGLTLDVAYSRIDICGREVFEVSEGRLIFVPDTQAVTLDFIDELVRREPERVVFREASFDGDDGLMLAARQAAQRHAVVLHTV